MQHGGTRASILFELGILVLHRGCCFGILLWNIFRLSPHLACPCVCCTACNVKIGEKGKSEVLVKVDLGR